MTYESAEGATHESAEGATHESAEGGTVGPRLLLVEDEGPNRALFRAIVSRAHDPRLRSATIVEAPTLAVARDALASGSFELIVLDVRLPDGNGLDLARDLARDAVHRTPVLVLSASVLPKDQAAALASGADAFIAKPYDAAELVSALTDLIAGGRRAPESSAAEEPAADDG